MRQCENYKKVWNENNDAWTNKLDIIQKLMRGEFYLRNVKIIPNRSTLHSRGMTSFATT